MTRRERLMAALTGKPVDRTPVNFYEVGGVKVDPASRDPFNIYNDPSWQPLLQLAEEKTELIRMMSAVCKPSANNVADRFFKTEEFMEDGSRLVRTTVKIAGRTLTSLARRNPDVDTVWTLEHLLKDKDDAEAYLQLPHEAFAQDIDVSGMIEEDRSLGERGIVMMNIGDPICAVAPLFSMEDFTVVAFMETELFHRLLEQASRRLHDMTERVAREFPGHLWRICGPEYAAEPYLPSRLFEEYVVRYTGPIVKMIQRHGGFARLHCHGRIRSLLPYFRQMGVDAIDPIEPPTQGNVDLGDVRREYGKDFTLFGNLEISDIENMDPAAFVKVVEKSIRDGTGGQGRGFVLMPSASPYGRTITAKTMANYETMVRLALAG